MPGTGTRPNGGAGAGRARTRRTARVAAVDVGGDRQIAHLDEGLGLGLDGGRHGRRRDMAVGNGTVDGDPSPDLDRHRRRSRWGPKKGKEKVSRSNGDGEKKHKRERERERETPGLSGSPRRGGRAFVPLRRRSSSPSPFFAGRTRMYTYTCQQQPRANRGDSLFFLVTPVTGWGENIVLGDARDGRTVFARERSMT